MCVWVLQEPSESADAVLIDCLKCGKGIPLSQWHAHDNDCEGGSSSGNSTESSIREGSGDIQGGNLEATSSLNRGKKSYNNK